MLIAIGSNVIYVKSLTKIFLPIKEGKGWEVWFCNRLYISLTLSRSHKIGSQNT